VLEDSKHKQQEHPGGLEWMKKLGGDGAGLPFFAFLDAKGEMIINAKRNGQSNIGYPLKQEETDWFLTMLKKAAPAVTAQELKTVEDWLKNQPR
jgi:hypothetical protein